MFADQRTALRPQRPAQPLHRRRSIGTIDVPQFAHRARATQIPIAPAVPPHVPPARFPPLEAFGRRPPAYLAPTLIGPASETLHMSDKTQAEHNESAHPPIADMGADIDSDRGPPLLRGSAIAVFRSQTAGACSYGHALARDRLVALFRQSESPPLP